MGQQGVLAEVSAVGIHGFPGTWDSEKGVWQGWEELIAQTRDLLAHYNPAAEVWITEAGYSTWRHDEVEQVQIGRESCREGEIVAECGDDLQTRWECGDVTAS